MTDTAQQPTDDKTPAAGAAAAAGAAGSPPPADNTPPASDAGTAPQAYRPEGLPDHFAGKDDRETIDKLHKAVDGFRKEQGKKGVPETPDGYELALPDDIKQKVLRPGEDGKDALFETMKQIAHKHGQSKTAFSEMAGELYQAVAAMAAAGGDPAAAGADAGPPADFEFKSLGGADKATPLIEGATVWIKGLQQAEKISEEVAKELQLLTTYSEGLQTLNALRGLAGEPPIPLKTGGDSPPDAITEEILKERVKDPRHWNDPAYRKETTEMFEKLYSNQK